VASNGSDQLFRNKFYNRKRGADLTLAVGSATKLTKTGLWVRKVKILLWERGLGGVLELRVPIESGVKRKGGCLLDC